MYFGKRMALCGLYGKEIKGSMYICPKCGLTIIVDEDRTWQHTRCQNCAIHLRKVTL